MYTITRELIALAVKTGLELLGSESETHIPLKMLDGCSLLKVFLSGIARGEIAVSAVDQLKAEEVVEVPLDQSEDEGE